MRFIPLVLALLVAAVVPIRADEPPHYTFDVQPPGVVVQSQVVYLAGQAMHSQWRGVLSKKVVGTSGSTTSYQWYLSIYQIDGTTYHLRYQSPRDGGPFNPVEKAHGANMWFPHQRGKIVGAAALGEPGIEQLVVQSHEMAADCGNAAVSVFGTNNGRVVMETQVKNPCDLSASIAQRPNGSAVVRLTGPYYAKGAPRCCPTTAKATATLHFMDGRWMVTPSNLFHE